MTPYQFAGNNPIFNIDNDGRDIVPFIHRDDAGNITMIEFVITGKIVFQDGINRSDKRKAAIGEKINAGINETWIIENGAGNSIPPEWRNADGSAIKFQVTSKLEVANESDVVPEDHVVYVVNTLPKEAHNVKAGAYVNDIGGKTMYFVWPQEVQTMNQATDWAYFTLKTI